MKRIILMLTVAALLVVAMTVPAAPSFAKQKTTFQKGQTTTHRGNSVHSPVVSCHHGAPGSNGSAC